MTHTGIPLKPYHWSELPNGAVIRESIEEALFPWWPRVFGYYMLSLGPLSAKLDKTGVGVSCQYSLFDEPEADIVADYSQLPIQNACVDAVVMNFLLEFEADPYRLLREVDRVLISGGYLIIVGFNPLSSMFLGKVLPKHQQEIPWNGRFFMPSRVKDWLGLLGYQVVADERLLHHHLLNEVKSDSIWSHALKSWLPSTGSLYVLVARKLETPLTPMRSKRKVKQPNWSTAPSAGRTGHTSQSTK
ncbi:methyltransferase type 11 [Shewanella sp. Choline-02u-19]|uniref:class I SAM-dependent methyltransferase n=1 Tax=unclassified Shewanella TaxID=196818 RepID=UPI000C344681|nr:MULTISPECIES: class I SAM-dependent methyltransferase [unclassified Shewanella]PKG59278.1 methyltransferase type 11 [Shewanella sp. GutDb-MelDb]PKG75433.1 methyltransferase type 11 [Shewanella sp. GutCb]PKH56147.1 methyltransferase type 11 [Shewanella sp. Bg11-22]PKI27302.1 methyltransferase type 11 [Shewanella sp. Choline-02u-19]